MNNFLHWVWTRRILCFMFVVCCFFIRVVWAMPKLVYSTAFEGNLAGFDSIV